MSLKILARQLRAFKRSHKWGWERLCREMHRVMETEGPSHTTLFRYARGRVSRPNVMVQEWVEEALELLMEEED